MREGLGTGACDLGPRHQKGYAQRLSGASHSGLGEQQGQSGGDQTAWWGWGAAQLEAGKPGKSRETQIQVLILSSLTSLGLGQIAWPHWISPYM